MAVKHATTLAPLGVRTRRVAPAHERALCHLEALLALPPEGASPARRGCSLRRAPSRSRGLMRRRALQAVISDSATEGAVAEYLARRGAPAATACATGATAPGGSLSISQACRGRPG